MSYNDGIMQNQTVGTEAKIARPLSLLESLSQKREFHKRELVQVEETLACLQKNDDVREALESLSKVASIHIR